MVFPRTFHSKIYIDSLINFRLAYCEIARINLCRSGAETLMEKFVLFGSTKRRAVAFLYVLLAKNIRSFIIHEITSQRERENRSTRGTRGAARGRNRIFSRKLMVARITFNL